MAKPRTAVKTAKKSAFKLVGIKGFHHMDDVRFKTNTNGTKYIATEFGAVYARIDDAETGLYVVAEVTTGEKGASPMLVLNKPTKGQVMQFITQMKEESGWAISDIRDFYCI